MREISTKPIEDGEYIIIDGAEYVGETKKNHTCLGCVFFSAPLAPCSHIPCGNCIMVKVEKQPIKEEEKTK